MLKSGMKKNGFNEAVILVDLADGKAWDLTEFAEELKDLSGAALPPDLITCIKACLHEIGYNSFRILNTNTNEFLDGSFDEIDLALSKLLTMTEAEENDELFNKVKEALYV